MAQAGMAIDHSSAFRVRRFLNWFPMGLAYAFLYMGRYNLTVAQTSLSHLITKEDFGVIFGAGTFVYAFSFLFNGPLVDRLGGRRGILVAVSGSMAMNLIMGIYLNYVLKAGHTDAPLRLVLSVLYAGNMYFQSFGAVSIVKVNAHWFHVKERGGFSGIFGTMISSGIFLAFTVNAWFLEIADKLFPGAKNQPVVFLAPAALLAIIGVVEYFLLRDRPSEAGQQDFDTGDASSGDTSTEPLPTGVIFKRLFTNPIILTVAFIEFCTGVLRNGVMHWFPIYVKEVWVLPKSHYLVNGSWENLWIIAATFVLATVSFLVARKLKGTWKGVIVSVGSLAFLLPFLQGGWGGILMVAGVIGGNVAGWVSDLFFQSRRGPAAAGLYGFLAICSLGMLFTLAKPGTEVSIAPPPPKDGPALPAEQQLLVGDKILSVAGKPTKEWSDVAYNVACVRAECQDSGWDAVTCTCNSELSPSTDPIAKTIAITVERGGSTVALDVPDPRPKMRAGDRRTLGASPALPMSPYWLGAIVFLMSLCVIGTHGLLSGTATMDFGGRKAAATAVGMIDGFVYLGTALQSISLGFITSKNWAWWPPFLLPFAIIGFLLCLRIWNAKPGKGGGGH